MAVMTKSLEVGIRFSGGKFSTVSHDNHVAGLGADGVAIFRSPVDCVIEFSNHDFFGIAYQKLPANVDVELQVLVENQQTDFNVLMYSQRSVGTPPPIITP